MAQTWARIGPRRGFAYEAAVRCIAMHPKQHKILFAGTEKGIYRSEDGGANWKYVDSALNAHYVWVIAFDPVNPDIMFAGTGTPTPAMLFRSKDGGQSWEKRPVEVATECEAVGTPRLPGSPSIRWNPTISGPASKWTARGIAATAEIHGDRRSDRP